MPESDEFIASITGKSQHEMYVLLTGSELLIAHPRKNAAKKMREYFKSRSPKAALAMKKIRYGTHVPIKRIISVKWKDHLLSRFSVRYRAENGDEKTAAIVVNSNAKEVQSLLKALVKLRNSDDSKMTKSSEDISTVAVVMEDVGLAIGILAVWIAVSIFASGAVGENDGFEPAKLISIMPALLLIPAGGAMYFFVVQKAQRRLQSRPKKRIVTWID